MNLRRHGSRATGLDAMTVHIRHMEPGEVMVL